MAYDAVRERTVLVGLANGIDTWEWDGNDWCGVATLGGVSGFGAIAYNAVSRRTMYYEPTTARTYSWDGVRWTPLSSQASPPVSTTGNAMMIFDEARGVALLHINRGFFDPGFGTWEWDGLLWRQVSPVDLLLDDVAYDPKRGVVVARGSGVFEWNSGGWRQVSTDSGGFGPLTYDSTLAEIVGISYPEKGVMAWNGSRWLQIPTDTAPPLPSYAALAFDARRGRTVHFAGLASPVETWEFVALPAAYSAFGAGCAGSNAKVPNLQPAGDSLPQIGSPFNLRLSDLPPNGSTVLVLGLSKKNWLGIPLPLRLDFLAMPGCTNYIDHLLVFPVVVNAAGSAVWSLVVPNRPGLCFYNQAFAVDASANGLGLIASNAGEGVIGR